MAQTATLVPMHDICGHPFTDPAAAQARANQLTRERRGRWKAKKCPLGCGNHHVYRDNLDQRRRGRRYSKNGA